jgi:hypothetical protein
MGQSYWFECEKCGYRAKISGRADCGLNFFVQTVLCQDCRELYDAVTRLRVPDESRMKLAGKPTIWRRPGTLNQHHSLDVPPTFQSLLNRLPYAGVKRYRWVHFPLQCPVSAWHQIQNWDEPGKCPRCGVFLERNALPYRIWE